MHTNPARGLRFRSNAILHRLDRIKPRNSWPSCCPAKTQASYATSGKSPRVNVEPVRFQTFRALSASVCLLLGGCVAGYMPENLYWDARVDELCKKDGGITIYETLELPTAQYERHLQHGELWFPRTFGPEAKRSEPLYARYNSTRLRADNPEVTRSTLSLVRGSDHRVLATRVTYMRDFQGTGGFGPQLYKHECPKIPDEVFFSQVVKERHNP